MKKTLTIAILFLLTLSSCTTEQTDEEQITSVYKKYYTAMTDKRTDVMVECINSNTVTYYDEIVRKAQFSDSIELNSASLIDRTLALFVRHTVTPENLRNYSGKELMFFTLSKGINTQSGLPKIELKKVTVTGDMAEAGFLMDGQDYGNIVMFVKEMDNWKIDLSSMYNNFANDQFRQRMLQSGLSENNFIQMMVTNLSGIQMPSSLWNQTIN